MRELARQLIQSGAFNLHDADENMLLDDEDGSDIEAEEEVQDDNEQDEEAEAERREALGNAVLVSAGTG